MLAGTSGIDPTHSTVSFAARHTMLGNVSGRFMSCSGHIVIGEHFLDLSVTISVDMASVSTGIDQRDECIRSINILDVPTYPTMTYRSTGLCDYGGPLVLEGWLTLRGVTRFVPLELEVAFLGGPDAAGRAGRGFRATGSFNRGDFGIGTDLPVDGGGVVISDEVDFQLAIYRT